MKYGDTANFAEMAHIPAVGKTGPRHLDEMSKGEINKIENLMLLCAEHHKFNYFKDRVIII